MSYYVTLPSNGADLTSDYGKQHNTQTDFEIDLKVPLNLNHNYKVGLSEISYKKSWLVNIGKVKLIDNLTNNIINQVDIEVLDGISVKKLLSIISNRINDNKKNEKLLLNTQHKWVGLKLISNNFVEINLPLGLNLEIEGYFASLLKNRTSDIDERYGMTYLELVAEKNLYDLDKVEYLNNHHIVMTGGMKKIKLNISRREINYIENIYVYTDIITDQHVGSNMLKLLKIIPVSGKFDQISSHTFYFPHYLSLDSRHIDRIRMMLYDSEGKKIRFADEHSHVIHKLHFINKCTNQCV